MTKLNEKQFVWCIIWIFFLFGSCTVQENPKPDPPQDQLVNEWVEETMRQYYLWEDEIPPTERLDLTQDAETFFLSLLSDKDGKTRGTSPHYYYSTINKKSSDTKAYQGEGYSFGFEFQYYYFQKMDLYALLLLYVLPGSPAAQEGLKRGDWIVEINDKSVPGDAASLLKALDTTSPVTTSFGITSSPGSPGSPVSRKLLTASQVTDDPVFLSKTIHYGGRKIGYLVYNHFTAGPTESSEDEQFNNNLRKAFTQFKKDLPDEFILDLRYNSGGLVSAAQLLATMLAPEAALNDVFCYLSYNGKESSYPDRSLKLDPLYMKQGASGENLDLSRLYVITSSRTASASEAVINGLKPYLGNQLILVGATTEGKNVGSVTFEDDRFDWELHPIVSRLSNKDKESGYENGIDPTYPCDEKDASAYYDLGDEREFMLKPILDYIAHGTPISLSILASLRSTDKQAPIPLYNSLDRKRPKGVILNH
ncbi:MAG: hypothetical protein LBQ65_03375 [Tannerellaceae bacterium]|jgi:C-terminal processing protease CtpA/Prc|nr:hypothetical protein [Tannerellaceae bacterium]